MTDKIKSLKNWITKDLKSAKIETVKQYIRDNYPYSYSFSILGDEKPEFKAVVSIKNDMSQSPKYFVRFSTHKNLLNAFVDAFCLAAIDYENHKESE